MPYRDTSHPLTEETQTQGVPNQPPRPPHPPHAVAQTLMAYCVPCNGGHEKVSYLLPRFRM